MRATIYRELYALLDSTGGELEPVEVRIMLSWTPTDPYAVSMSVTRTSPKRSENGWILSRELLGRALIEPSGMGDVRCFSSEDHFTITLFGSGKNADQSADLVLDRYEIIDLLDDTTFDPDSAEYLAVFDDELAEILESESA